MNKNLLTELGEAIDRYRASRPEQQATQPISRPGRLRGWLPTKGNVAFTLVAVVALALAGRAGAIQFAAPSASSTAVIPYQGRLANADGSPFSGSQNMEFRLYATPTGGTPLWTEFWTGSNAVNVSDGLFSVLLGSLNTGLAGVVQANGQAHLGVTVGTDAEMAPRVQLGSAAYAMQALTVPDGSIGAAKLADNAVTTTKLVDGSVTTAKLGAGQVVSTSLADNAITSAKIVDGQVTAADIVTGAITTTKIADASVTSGKLRLDSGTSCLATNTNVNTPPGWQNVPVPGIGLSFSLERPSRVLTWMDGLATSTKAGVNIVLTADGSDVVSAANVTGVNEWFNVKGQRILDLSSGAHLLAISANTLDSAVVSVNGELQRHRLCINYVVLGEQ